jgi:pyruvate/2-oxoglutarate dehydrogenase complex dihydrolipoamide acyltransferase (E2) component
MPALSSTMTEGKVVSWLKSVGDFVEAGDALMVVESDKADMDVESFEEGYLAKIITGEGDSAAVGAPVAILVETPEEIDAAGVSVVAAPAVAAAAAAAPAAGGASDVEVIEMAMPALSSTMTEGKIVSWLVGVGDKVEAGDPVMVVESDKADMDVESFEDGYVAAILTGEGESASVGAAVALLAESEEAIGAVAAAGAGGGGGAAAAPAAAAAAPAAAAATAPTAAAPAAAIVNEGRVVASGYAKKLAGERGVDLRTVAGTGPNGRITADDVEASPGGAYVHVPAAGVVAATPMAQELAKKNKLDLATVAGTGNFGRVTEDDVLIALGKAPKKAQPAAPAAAAPAPAAAAAAPAPAAAAPAVVPKAAKPAPAAAAAFAPAPAEGVVPMSGMMASVAKNMEATLQVPAFRVSRTIVMDEFDNLYAVSA